VRHGTSRLLYQRAIEQGQCGYGINGTAAQTRWNTTPAPQVYLNADYTATPKLVFHADLLYAPQRLQNSAVAKLRCDNSWLNTAANMPGGAARTFPIISGLNVNRSGVPKFRNQQRSVL